MKKDRDCNAGMTPYPIYQPYPIGMPQMGTNMIPQMNPSMNNPNIYYNPNMYSQEMNNTIEQQLSKINNQINSLERRIMNLENLIGNTNTQYNTSNYQVM